MNKRMGYGPVVCKRKFYGIRFFGGNRTCTTGTPNKVTGRMSVACNVQVFRSAHERDVWVSREKLSEPCGCDGGERIACTKRYARSKNLGISVEAFERDLRNAEWFRCQLPTTKS
jgi:hypothetical protein